MNVLGMIVLLAEAATLLVMVTYAAALTSMHIEAGLTTEPPPRLDSISRSLVSAAKYGFWLGLFAVIVGSLFWKGLM